MSPSARTWVPSSSPGAVAGQRSCPCGCGGTGIHPGGMLAHVQDHCRGSCLPQCPCPGEWQLPLAMGWPLGAEQPQVPPVSAWMGEAAWVAGGMRGDTWRRHRGDTGSGTAVQGGMQGRVGLPGGVLLPPCGSFIISWFLRWHCLLPKSPGGMAEAAGGGGFVLGICGCCLSSELGRGSALEWLFT